MKIFFDENFSPHLARGFAAFEAGRRSEGIEVLHVRNEFGQGSPDEDWIPKVAQMHGVIITQDLNIHRTRQLAELLDNHKAGVFFFRPPKKGNYGYWQIIRWVMKSWEPLKHCAHSTTPPFQYKITPRCHEPERI